MSEHKVTLKWERGGTEFSYQRYPRDHTWSFDGGHTMTATAAPAYLGNPANVDPEEAFVAALSSCHMLTFLAIACKQKFVLDSYEDAAVGHMEKNADGKMAITRVELRPKITWSGDRRPSAEELDKMHHSAHENCFIANSVKTQVTVAKLYSLEDESLPQFTDLARLLRLHLFIVSFGRLARCVAVPLRACNVLLGQFLRPPTLRWSHIQYR